MYTLLLAERIKKRTHQLHMTHFQQEFLQIKSTLYSNEHLITRVIAGKHFMDQHFQDAPSLETICTAACLSKFHFIRSFTNLYGTTPGRYLQSIRITHAKTLLKKNISVTDVCLAVGFESATSFTGLFKKMTGTPPALYRHHHKKAITKS